MPEMIPKPKQCDYCVRMTHIVCYSNWAGKGKCPDRMPQTAVIVRDERRLWDMSSMTPVERDARRARALTSIRDEEEEALWHAVLHPGTVRVMNEKQLI